MISAQAINCLFENASVGLSPACRKAACNDAIHSSVTHHIANKSPRSNKPPAGRALSSNRWFAVALTLCGLAALAIVSTSKLWIAPISPPTATAAPIEKRLSHRAIDQIQVGDRVLAQNPTGERDDSLSEVDPATWRKITLRASKRDGTHADVVFLRSKTWLQERDAHAGGTIEISVPECGIDGHAEVLRIDPCPPIKPGKGQVVTGTYRHESARVLDIWMEGQSEPIGTTANHPFWSEDRCEFVPAARLEIGEGLRMVAGMGRVERVAYRQHPESVFNIEVHGEHVYHVGREGVLVHNAGNQFPCEGAWDYYMDLRRKNPNMTHEQAKELVYHQFGRPGMKGYIKTADGEYWVAKHSDFTPRPPDTRSHHGLMSAWMKEHYSIYDPKKAPTVFMPTEQHYKTTAVYNKWRAEIERSTGGFDWKKVTEPDMRRLSEEMFDAGKVPHSVRGEYWREFDAMKSALGKGSTE